MNIQTGTPTVDGRYVVYTPCAARQIREWCEPHIATWHGGKWIFNDPVKGWIGPLPLCNQATLSEEGLEHRTEELWPEGNPELGGTEYDL